MARAALLKTIQLFVASGSELKEERRKTMLVLNSIKKKGKKGAR